MVLKTILNVAIIDRACYCSVFPGEAQCVVGVVDRAGFAVPGSCCIILMSRAERRPRIHDLGTDLFFYFKL